MVKFYSNNKKWDISKGIKLLALVFAFLFSFQFSFSQTVGNIVIINSENTTGLNICFSEKTIKVFFENPSPFTLKNISVNVSMPSGVDYVPGSILGAGEQNITALNSPIFSIDSIQASTFDTLTFNVFSTCATLPFLDSGGVAKNTIRVDYTANGYNFYDVKTIEPYNIEAPNLSITQITNQTYSGSVGDSYQRCITIVNGGTGALKNFTLEETHGLGVDIANISIGNWTSSAGLETINFNGAHFATIGDGDALFETGESIVICEDITLIDCKDNLSEYLAFWGCGGNVCQSSFETANAFFPGIVPTLVTSTTSSSSLCFTDANTQSITIRNDGPGNAVDVLIDIRQANYNYSDLDISSLIMIDALGDSNAIIPDSLYNKANSTVSCLSNPKSGFKIRIPSILVGDSITLFWDVYNCCKTSCGSKNYGGWSHTVSYKNSCGGYYTNGTKTGRTYGTTRANIVDNANPGSLVDGDAGTFSYLVNEFSVARLGTNTNGFFRIEFTKSPCISYTGNLKFTNAAGTFSWNADSSYQTSNKIVGIFEAPIPTNFARGLLSFDYAVSCAGCSGGTSSIGLDIFYVPDTNCGCELHMICTSFAPMNIFCPDEEGCEGFLIKKYSYERLNFDNPDYDENGLPDNNLAAHKDSVEKRKIIYGDTVISVITGKVLSDTTWDYLYGVSNIDNKDYLSLLSADLTIVDSSGNTYVYNNMPYSINNISATEEEYLFDFTVDTLSKYGVLPIGFKYRRQDSVALVLKYFAENNTSGNLRNISNTVRIYLSDIVNPVSDTNKFDCYEPLGNIVSVNHYITLSGGTDYKIKTCENLLLRMNYYFSVGPCCNNYNGGNIFKKEYRNFSTLQTMGLRIPSGYNVIFSRIRENRTRGTGGGSWSAYKYITPISNINDSITFKLDSVLYTPFGGPAYPSDEGFYGTLDVMLEPTCAALSDTITKVPYWVTFDQDFNGIPLNSSKNYNRPTVQFTAPTLILQAVNPSLVTPDNTVTWTLLIDNLSNTSFAPNLWFRKANTSGVNIVSIYDVKNNRYLNTNAAGIFLSDTVLTGENRQFKVTATFTSCNQDSILLDMGWSCQGFPTSVADIDCDPLSIKLSVTPLLGALETKVINQSDTIDLCDTAFFMYEATSIQRGTVYELEFSSLLPAGLTIVPGSSYLSLFDTLSFVNINDPVNVFGTKWKWSLYNNSQYLDTNGLKGILNPTINKCYIKFKAITTCGFASGNTFKSEFFGKSSCGMPTNIASVGTEPLNINSATPAYSSTIDIRTTYLTPCLNNTYVELAIVNNGPDSTFLSDSITVQLPNNIDYVPSSFTGIYNAPNPTHSYSTDGFDDFYKWGGINRIPPGDSVVFSFYINANPSDVNCDVFSIRVFNESFGSSYCDITNSFCSISTIIEDTSKNVFTYKAYLNILNQQGYAEYYNDSSEIGYINFDIFNSGEEIRNTINTYVNFYFDADNNGVFSASDIWISTDTIFDSIPSVSTYNYSTNLIIPSGQSCNIIAVIDTSDNPCTCVPSQALIPLPYTTNLTDTVICANNSFNIGVDSIIGYNYSWTPALYLSDPTSAYPVFNYPFNPVNDTVTYVLEIDRVNCFHYDTMQIIINGNPLSDAGIDQFLCDTFNTVLIGNTPLNNGDAFWRFLSGPNTPTFSNLNNDTLNISAMVEGVYSIERLATNGICDTIRDTVEINIYNPPVSDAGPDDSLCGVYNYTLNGNQPLGTATGEWIFISGPNTPTISDSSLYNATISGLVEGVYSLQWKVSNGNCPPVYDTVLITIFDGPTSNAGPNQDLCDLTSTSLNGNQPLGTATGEWIFISGPNTPTVSDSSLYTASLTNLTEGTYYFVWRVSNGMCPPVTDTVVINVYNSPTSNAGPNQDLCAVYTTSLNGSIPVGTSVGNWVLNFGPSMPIIVDDSLYNTQVNNLIEGTYSFSWIISNGTCDTATDTVEINVYDQPVSNAGPDQFLCNQYTTNLAANPATGTTLGVWSVISGPNTPVFANDSLNTTSISGLIQGDYLLKWTLSNGNCPISEDTVLISVSDLPISNAGANQNLCNQYTTTLNGNIPPVGAVGTWHLESGPNSITIADTNLHNTSATFFVEGEYVLVWSVANGNCPPVTDTVIINVFDSPVSVAGTDINLCNEDSTSLAGNNPIGTSTGMWNVLSGPNTPVIDSVSIYNTPITGLIEGVYELEWTVSNGVCTPAIDTVLINVYNMPVSITGADIQLCEEISTPITANPNAGTATGVWNIINAPNIPNIVNTNASSTTILNLIEGVYELEWEVSNGTCPVVKDTLIISNHPKPNVSFIANITSVCEQECINFTNTSNINAPDSNKAFYWTFSDGQISTDENPTICFYNQGAYDVELKIISNNNCSDSAINPNYITIHPKPVAYFTINPSVQISTYQDIGVTDGSIYGNFYNYDFGNGKTSTDVNPHFFYADTGDYLITQIIESQFGCKDTFEREVRVFQEMLVYVPNTFTPDEDNTNEIFKPSLIGVDEDNYEFLVFNRWGQLIFTTDDINKGWDGTYKNVLSQTDTYVWKINCQSKATGEKFNYIGHVNLLK